MTAPQAPTPPTSEMTFDELLNEAWEQEWEVRFLGVGCDNEKGWEVSITNWVTNRRIGMELVDLHAGSPLEALRAAIHFAKGFDRPRWHDNGEPYGVWLYPGDEGYPDAEVEP